MEQQGGDHGLAGVIKGRLRDTLQLWLAQQAAWQQPAAEPAPPAIPADGEWLPCMGWPQCVEQAGA